MEIKKVKRLVLNKEKIANLSSTEQKKLRGGRADSLEGYEAWETCKDVTHCCD